MSRYGRIGTGADCFTWWLAVIVDPMKYLSSPLFGIWFALMVLGNNWLINSMVLLVFLEKQRKGRSFSLAKSKGNGLVGMRAELK